MRYIWYIELELLSDQSRSRHPRVLFVDRMPKDRYDGGSGRGGGTEKAPIIGAFVSQSLEKARAKASNFEMRAHGDSMDT